MTPSPEAIREVVAARFREFRAAEGARRSQLEAEGIVLCSLDHPYKTDDHPPRTRVQHPSVRLDDCGDHVDYYRCEVCLHRWSVELPE